jgi:hypothetical protein
MARTTRRRHRLDRAHVVRAVGELHEDDAQVSRHREQHLAEAFRLRFLAALELDLVELGDGVDELGDVLAERAASWSFGVGVSSMTSWRMARRSCPRRAADPRGCGSGYGMSDVGSPERRF